MLVKKRKNNPVIVHFYIYFYSYDFIFLNKVFFFIQYFYRRMLLTFNDLLPLNFVCFGNAIFFKKRKKFITVLRSPHGHKRTMERFVFGKHKAFVRFSVNISNISKSKHKLFTSILFQYILNRLCLNFFQNVFIVIKKRRVINK